MSNDWVLLCILALMFLAIKYILLTVVIISPVWIYMQYKKHKPYNPDDWDGDRKIK